MRSRAYCKVPLAKEARRLLYGRCRFDQPLMAKIFREAFSDSIPEGGTHI